MKNTLFIILMASGLFCTTFADKTLCKELQQEHAFGMQGGIDSFSCIKQSTTETAVLPNDFVLKFSFTDYDISRWMAAEEFRKYWDYRDTAYMVDALHFLMEKFCFDTIGALEASMAGRQMSAEERASVAVKIFDQRMGKDAKNWFFGITDDDCIEFQSEESLDFTCSEADADNSWQDEECCESGDAVNQDENDSFVNDIIEGISTDVVDESQENDHSQLHDNHTFSTVIDFYHIVLFRVAQLLTPKDGFVLDTMRKIEVDLLLSLYAVIRSYEQSENISEASFVDEKIFAVMKDAYRAMLFVGRDFLHAKLRTASASTIQLVNEIGIKTGKNITNLNYLDFEKWFDEQNVSFQQQRSFQAQQFSLLGNS